MIYKGRKESRYLDTWKFERQKLEITRRAKVKMIEKADWGRVKGKRKAAKVFFHKEGEIRDLEDCKTRTAAKGCEIVCVCVYLECSDKDGVIWESARCPVKKVFPKATEKIPKDEVLGTLAFGDRCHEISRGDNVFKKALEV
ncbi:uncharacterized protein [Euwallacea similis]|uniref:uncharacterized protein n=1 Tax=Euwallacea similis TaxID=1736056 RepID=UPI00344C3DC3